MRDDVAHVWQGRDDVVHTPHGMHAPRKGTRPWAPAVMGGKTAPLPQRKLTKAISQKELAPL